MAPAAVWFVASIGITGGRSDGPVTFGPVRGTSAGTVGTVAFGRPAEVVFAAVELADAVLRVVTAADVVGAGMLVVDFATVAGAKVPLVPVVDMVAGGYVVSSAFGLDADVQAVSAPAVTQPARTSGRIRIKIPMKNIVPNQTLCA